MNQFYIFNLKQVSIGGENSQGSVVAHGKNDKGRAESSKVIVHLIMQQLVIHE